MARICDDSCTNCIYIGEGDFICSAINELVMVDWTPVNEKCIRHKKKELFNDKKTKRNFRKSKIQG